MFYITPLALHVVHTVLAWESIGLTHSGTHTLLVIVSTTINQSHKRYL
jgi:hypothetical protein